MCIEITPRNRRLITLASSCLALGLLLPMAFHPAASSTRNLLHFVCGLLLGLSMSINLSAVWKNSRKRRLGIGPRV
jgi:hypothetical protein